MTAPAREAGRVGAARRRLPHRWLGGWLKRLLPASLFGRTLLILITPLVLAQMIAAYIFFDRHWDNVVSRLARAVAGEIAMTIEEARDAPDVATRERIFSRAQRHTGIAFFFDDDGVLAAPADPPQNLMERQLTQVMKARIPYRFTIETLEDRDKVIIRIALDGGVLRVESPLARLYTLTANLFFAWMVGSAVVLFAVAIVFLRNQVRSIKRLAVAADRFGRGQDVPQFRPEGAREVRQAARAFIEMRDRIRRQIQQRTDMLSGVSHDLRTPLTRMKLQLAMLGDGDDIRELREDVAEMQRMIDGYLAFARGDVAEAPVPVRLDELVGEAAASARREGMDVTATPAEPVTVSLRPAAIRRCIANLLSNAGRHAAHAWIGIARPGPGAVEILVDDDGPGIPPALREEALKPFVRLDPSRNQQTGGAGLGLSIALDIARSHGGDLVLGASPMGGLRATIRLPL
jgi:two-component system osmolarity sensor histidine kinase EnvZ